MRFTATRRRRGWPSSASSPSSTGGRRAPGSPRRTAARSGSTRGWGSPRRCSRRISSRSSPGHLAIGHVRYSTTGSSVLSNAQPFLVHHADEYYALAHNGNLINALELRAELEERGSIFQSTMDSEVIVHLMAPHLKEGLEDGADEGPRAGAGRLQHRHADPEPRHRRPRPPGLPAPVARPASTAAGSWPRRPAPSTSSGRNTSGMSGPARSSSSTRRGSTA